MVQEKKSKESLLNLNITVVALVALVAIVGLTAIVLNAAPRVMPASEHVSFVGTDAVDFTATDGTENQVGSATASCPECASRCSSATPTSPWFCLTCVPSCGMNTYAKRIDYTKDNALNKADVYFLINVLFAGQTCPSEKTCDVNQNRVTDSKDVFYLIGALGIRLSYDKRFDYNDDRKLTQSDIDALINHLFAGAPSPCPDGSGKQCDVSCNGELDVQDVFALNRYVVEGVLPKSCSCLATYLPEYDYTADVCVNRWDIDVLSNYLFAGGSNPCATSGKRCDLNCDAQVTVQDLFALINTVTAGATPPPACP